MPYITQERRVELDPLIPDTSKWSAGDVVYGITKLVVKSITKPYCFLGLCIGVGILVCALLEFYRRAVAPYEDNKIKENGDAYDG